MGALSVVIDAEVHMSADISANIDEYCHAV